MKPQKARPAAPTNQTAGTYSPAEAAIKLGVCTDTVYRMIGRGELPVPVIRAGRKYRIPRVPFDNWIDAGVADAS